MYRRLIRTNIEPFIDPVPWTQAHTLLAPSPRGSLRRLLTTGRRLLVADRDRSFTKVFVLDSGHTYQWVAARTPGYVRMHFCASPHSSPLGWCRDDVKDGCFEGLQEALDHYWPENKDA